MTWLSTRVSRLFSRLEEERRERRSTTVAMVGLLVSGCLVTYDASLRATQRAVRVAARSAHTAVDVSPGKAERSRIRVNEGVSAAMVVVTTHERRRDLVDLAAVGDQADFSAGFFWDARHIVTRACLAGQARRVAVRLHDGRVLCGRLVGADPATGLAVFRVSGAVGARSLPLATLSELRVGQSVYAIGKTLGRTCSLSTGVIGALDRALMPHDGAMTVELLQTDAVISLDNVGGPLVDSRGRLVGVNTLIAGGSAVGVGYAVPVDRVRRLVSQLVIGE